MAIQWLGIVALAAMSPNFDGEAFVKQFPAAIKHPSTGILPWHFGKDFSTVQKFTARFSDRPHLVQYYLSNGPARRGGRLHGDSFAPGFSVSSFNRALEGKDKALLSYIRRKTLWLKSHHEAVANSNTQVMIAPELEDNLTDAAFNVFAHQVKRVWDVPLIRSACMGGDADGIAQYYERHGWISRLATAADVVTLDGLSIEFNDGEIYRINGEREAISQEQAALWLNRHRNAVIRNLWSANQQGLGQVKGYENWPVTVDREFVFTDQARVGMRSLLKGAKRRRG